MRFIKIRAELGFKIQKILMSILCIYMFINSSISLLNKIGEGISYISGPIREDTFTIRFRSGPEVSQNISDGHYCLVEVRIYYPNIWRKLIKQPGEIESEVANIVIMRDTVVSINGCPKKISADSMYELVHAWNQIRYQ